MSQSGNYAAAGGRLLLGVLFVVSGIGKLAAPLATQAYIASVGLPMPLVAYVLATVVEVGGGLALILGFRARLVAVGIAIFTLATAVLFHSNFADQNQMIHFLKNLSISGGLLQVAAFGAGRFSLDAWRARSRGNTARVEALQEIA
jgi:putative oxidoreductase